MVERRFGRRVFTHRILPLVTSGLIISGCMPQRTPVSEKRLPTEIPNPLEARIQQAVEALPPSSLKDLARIVLPYFSYPKPTTRDYAGVPVTFLGSRFNYFPKNPLTEGTTSVKGNYNLRGNIGFVPEPIFALDPTTIKIPLLYLIRPEEKVRTIPKDAIDSDGTVFAPFTYTNKTAVYEGISPVLELHSSANSATGSRRELVNRMEDFTLVKEALTAALLDTWILEAVRTMREKCWSLYIEGAKKDQKPYIVEALSQSIIELMNHAGRFLALVDLGASYAAIKAVEGTAVVNDLRNDRQFSPIVTWLQDKALGTTPREILFNVFTLAVNAPSEYRPSSLYNGDITTIP